MPHPLHLKSLKLLNFKGVAELELALDESLTLLAGVNGVGKTSVIQALVAAVTHTWHQKPPHEYPVYPLSDNVTRAGTAGTEIALEFSWGERLPVPARFTLDRTLARLRQNLESLTEQLPLIAYYEQNRVASASASPGLVSVSSEVNRNSSLWRGTSPENS